MVVATPRSLLVVDDRADVAETYARWLYEYEVQTATGDREALRRIEEGVDLVLLDRRMPGLSGDEVLDHVRRTGADCRVVIVSASPPDGDVIELGFDDYLQKPVSPRTLRRTVEEALRRSRYHSQVQRYYSLARRCADRDGECDEVTKELDAVRGELDATVTDFDHRDIRAAFRDCV